MDGLLYPSVGQLVMLFLGGTGLGPSATVSKNGGSFAGSVNIPAEVLAGWYSLLLDASECDTAGPLAIHMSAGTPSDFLFQVAPTVLADLVAWRGQVPNVLQASNVPGSVQAMASGVITGAAINASAVATLFSGAALTESYAADGSTATPAQLLYMIWSKLAEMVIAGSTMQCKKLDGTTNAMTFGLVGSTGSASITRTA